MKKFQSFIFMLFFMFISAQLIMAQTGSSVKGIIKDERGNTMPGVLVIIEGTVFKTFSTETGSYLLKNIHAGEYRIKASLDSFETVIKKITITDGKTIELFFVLKDAIFKKYSIQVTATKRSEDLQDVSQSISAITGTDLEARGITDTTTYIETLPGATTIQLDPTKTSIILRGVAPLGGSASTVGYYIGEAPVTAGWQTPSGSSFDVERIEVLRGPQGTLYGEGSMGGTVKIIPNKPNVSQLQFQFDPQLSFTSNGGLNQQYNAMVNVPIIENKLAIRTIAYYQNDEGYFYNVGLDSYANTFEKLGGRVALRYIANDKLYFTASAIYNKGKTGGRFVSNTDYEQTSSRAEPMTDEYSVYSLTANYGFSFADLTITGTYFKQNWNEDSDMADIIPTVNGLFGMFGFSPRTAVFLNRFQESTSSTVEARLVSTTSGPFKWTAGVFYKKFKSDFYSNSDSLPTFTQPDIDFVSGYILGTPPGTIVGTFYETSIEEPEQIAVFGELSYDITPKLNLLGGLRVFNETNYLESTSDGVFSVLTTGRMPETLIQESDETIVNPKVTLTYKVSDNILTYVNAAKGFRRGGLNVSVAVFENANKAYKSETLWNYELGLKTSSDDGKLVANAAFYYNVWTDMQVTTQTLAGMELTENVGKAHTTGVDGEINWRPIEGLLLSVNGNYTVAETDIDIEAHGGMIPSGTPLPLIPKLTLNMSAQYRIALSNDFSITPRIDYKYTGDRKTSVPDFVNGEELPANNVINLRFNLDYKGYKVYLFVNNLTDDRLMMNYFYNDPNVGKVYYMGRPRTVGLNFSYSFN